MLPLSGVEASCVEKDTHHPLWPGDEPHAEYGLLLHLYGVASWIWA